jgi:hypothetical protein
MALRLSPADRPVTAMADTLRRDFLQFGASETPEDQGYGLDRPEAFRA